MFDMNQISIAVPSTSNVHERRRDAIWISVIEWNNINCLRCCVSAISAYRELL